MEMDKFSCRVCHDKETSLHVHHTYYRKNTEPWDYPDEALVTLCEACHGRVEAVKRSVSEIASECFGGLDGCERFIVRYREFPGQMADVLRFMPEEFAKSYVALCERVWIASAKANGKEGDVR